MSYEILIGDVREKLKEIPDQTVQAVVTSPPYWNLRNYDKDDQLGQEKDAEDYITNMVEVFRECRRTLNDDGVFWLNVGDGYTNKNLDCIPWRLALALRADGWILRSDVIWHKTNGMPSSVMDRCSMCHEYIFMFAKNRKYKFDMKPIEEPLLGKGGGVFGGKKHAERGENAIYSGKKWNAEGKTGKHRRTVWSIATSNSKDAHFAVFPKKIPELAILSTSDKGDTILDPFSGTATTGVVACQYERNYIGVELNENYAKMSLDRLSSECALEEFLT